ncbi:MAG: response regulator transcription factor [Firmicutes bacterium]|jgi:DNA-binding response OmpR family regulator|nr:response regulator transcription factor [Bacillota bacterium]
MEVNQRTKERFVLKGQRILVVDDHPEIVDLVKTYLEREGYEVATAYTGTEVLPLVESFQPDLIVLDLMLPGMDGFTITRKLRADADVPIIMLTARDGDQDKIAGLELGADDYVTKPFSPRELVARIKVVLRRTKGQTPDNLIRIGELVIDPEGYTVTRNGEPIHLTATEFKLLLVMAQNPRRVFTRMQLMDRVHGYAFEGYERTIDAHIKNLRQKIEPNPRQPQYIVTVFGVGYKLEVPTDAP